MASVNHVLRQQFIKEGFALFREVLEPELVGELRAWSDGVLGEQEAAHFEQNRTTGSMVLIDWAMAYRYSVLGELIAHPRVLAALGALGFTEPKFGHGRIISKPPQSPPLFWHEDGRFWDDPVSYTWQPIQCFLMYYLTDTEVRNGCLRVVPGSHRKRHALHDQTAPMHTDELRTYTNPEDAAFQRAEGEIDVPVKAGDLVMGYGRLFHASHANLSDERRTVLTMWYYPHFVDLPERTQATIYSLEAKNGETGTGAGSALQARMEPLRIVYEGSAEPIATQWTPGPALK
ncbi:MAG: phytanoyl-CoA dioxygenase family protein [Caldilineaceae bacterium]|nr:phytanoyl-CoA dioxygenase family protein [Caldilineaceae bacterium]